MCYNRTMKLVMFCDYGLDDAAATVDILQHAEKDGYDSIHLVAIGGNVPADVALENACKLVSNLKFTALPLTIVDTVDVEQPAEYLAAIHGRDGMGDLFDKRECFTRVVKFAQWIDRFNGDYILVSLGPMTLVPLILKKFLPEKFVFMGGNVSETPNYGKYEFNHGINPAAFAECVKYKHVAITMDTCRNAKLNVQNKEIGQQDDMHRIVGRSRELSLGTREKGCFVWDDIAVKYLRHPDWFTLSNETDCDGNKLTVARYKGNREYLEIINE